MSEPSASTVSWRELTASAEARLLEAGLSSPAPEARRIAEEVAGATASELHALLDEAAGRRGVDRFDSLVARRVAGEPLQYVLGSWGFRGLDLMVDDRVLIPRPETEVVAGLAIAEVNQRGPSGTEVEALAETGSPVTVADLGTGSGAIAASIATECAGCRVFAADVSEDALDVARANLRALGHAAARVELCLGDWFDALPAEARGCIDVAVANPPYVADGEPLPAVVADWEPSRALRAGPQGDECLRRIIEDAWDWLAADGSLVLEMAPDQTEPMAALARSAGFVTTIHDDLAGRPRALRARR